VWLAYMDEAGNTGRRLDDAHQPIHSILSVVVEESMVPTLHEHLRETARDHCQANCGEDDFEFHGKDLFSGQGHFAGLPSAKRIEIYDDVLGAIEATGGLVIVRGVDKPCLQRRYPKPFHPHDIALMFTIESIERLAQDRDCRVLLVADEAKEVEDAALRDLANYQEFGTSWGWNTERIERIVDTIHFVRSKTNPGIQLADCAAFVAMRRRKVKMGLVAKGPSDGAIERLWTERIRPHVRHDAIWHPSG
jgi:uncharacterized protein DUF3800